MFLKSIYYFSILTLLILTAACKKAPNYPVEPSIAYMSLRVESVYQNSIDTAFIKISFKDGDGDIGFPTSSGANTNPYDFYVELQKKEAGVYTTIPSSILDLNGRLPEFSPSAGPLDGTIINKVQLVFLQDGVIGGLSRGDSVRFNVRIMDRSGNYSNWITTDAFKLWKNL